MQSPDVTCSLQIHERQLFDLCQLAGLNIQPQVVSILVQLLQMNVDPTVLHFILRKVCCRYKSRNTAPRYSGHKPAEKHMKHASGC